MASRACLRVVAMLCAICVTVVELRPQANEGPCAKVCWCKPGISISCKDSNLTELPDFSDVDSTTTTFDLSSNRIARIPAGAFKNFADMKTLSLQDNAIAEIEPNTFADSPKLRLLLLSRNLLTVVRVDMLAGLDGLTQLHLDHNRVTDLVTGAFDGLSSLKTLDISNNDIGGELPAEIFRNLATLQSLYINHLQLEKLPEDVFVDNRNLRSLWLANNSFSSVDDFLPNLRALPRLQTLDISQNPIAELPSQRFGDLWALTDLFIRKMPLLIAIKPRAFVNLPSLQALYIEDNRYLRRFDDNAFDGIFINGSDAVSAKVHFRGNNLNYLQEDLLPWENLSLIDLQQNPWHCDCRLAWMSKMSYIDKKLIDYVRCASPTKLQNHLIVGLNSSLFVCDGHSRPTSRSTTTTTMTIVMILAVLLLTTAVGTYAMKRFNVFKNCCRKREAARRYVSVIDSETSADDSYLIQEMEEI
ncbi:PREDICTED: chondroadherin-like [Priapulus caudatus]|uniref:Chondroadherin-like n=1 Tax=Priapulus caudatus TaxID=37621 RepID=A0ABM1EM66_PRICU|nr:PREDICTED: chondroadherin-like [Priapulus caudatus]